MNGVPELAGLLLDKQTRVAKPLHLSGLSNVARVSSFSTCAGLMIYGQKQKGPYAMLASRREEGGSSSRFGKIGGWLKENF